MLVFTKKSFPQSTSVAQLSNLKFVKIVIFWRKISRFSAKFSHFWASNSCLVACEVVSWSNPVPDVKRILIDINKRLYVHHLEAKNSEKWRFLKFTCVLTETGRPFLAEFRKNHFFPNYIHKTELHLRVARKLKIFFQSVTIIAHGPLTAQWQVRPIFGPLMEELIIKMELSE